MGPISSRHVGDINRKDRLTLRQPFSTAPIRPTALLGLLSVVMYAKWIFMNTFRANQRGSVPWEPVGTGLSIRSCPQIPSISPCELVVNKSANSAESRSGYMISAY